MTTTIYQALCACFGLQPSSSDASIPPDPRLPLHRRHDMPRGILRKAGIRPIPDPPEPLLLHEPEGSLWRLRCDLTIQLRSEEKQTHPARQGAVGFAPAVVIRI